MIKGKNNYYLNNFMTELEIIPISYKKQHKRLSEKFLKTCFVSSYLWKTTFEKKYCKITIHIYRRISPIIFLFYTLSEAKNKKEFFCWKLLQKLHFVLSFCISHPFYVRKPSTYFFLMLSCPYNLLQTRIFRISCSIPFFRYCQNYFCIFLKIHFKTHSNNNA